MDDKLILDEIKLYMKSELKSAIMIDGEWGCGKTFFVKNKLKGININYNTLYGISDLVALATNMVINTEIKKNKRACSVINSVQNIVLSMVGDNKEIANKIAELMSYLHFDNTLIVFDDLERSSIDIKLLFGFINKLVEHSGAKVLIISNERELEESLGEKAKEYKKIKEKLIYMTIKYQPNIDKIYSLIFKSNDIFKKEKDNALKIIYHFKHFNIRTLQFAKQKYSDFCDIYSKCISNIKNTEIKQEILSDIFKNILIISIIYKKGESLPELKNEQKRDWLRIGNDFNCTYMIIFKFINDFTEGVSVPEKEIDEVISKYIKSINKNTVNKTSELNALSCWWEKEDDELKNDIVNINNKVKNDEIDVENYFLILEFFVKTNSIGIENVDIKKLIDTMKKNIKNTDEKIIVSERMFHQFEDMEQKKEYLKWDKDLKNAIMEHNKDYKDKELSKILDLEENEIGEYFEKYCYDHKGEFIDNKSFFCNFDLNYFYKVLDKCNNVSLNHCGRALMGIYDYDNISTIYPNDAENIRKIIKYLSEKAKKEESKLKSHTYRILCNNLNNIIDNNYK